MDANFIVQKLRELETTSSAVGPIQCIFKPPLHLGESTKPTLKIYSHTGIYLLAEAGVNESNLPLEESNALIWYVGETGSNVHNRIRSHLGQQDVNLGYPDHRWKDLAYIPAPIRQALTKGRVILYPIEIRGAPTRQKLLPELVEKYLLVEYVLRTGSLPPLNIMF